MNLGITGATGLIGRTLIDHALRRGHEVFAFTRSPEKTIPGCTMRPFSLTRRPDFSDCEAVVHLAGESVVGKWTPKKKHQIQESRIQGTKVVVEAVKKAKPEVFVCASAIGFYGDHGDSEITEETEPGEGFLSETCMQWEYESMLAEGTRTVNLRTGIVLAREGGALPAMLSPFRWGLGAKLGSGQQWMSWIHLEDEIRLILFAIENQDVEGPLNATAPWPVRNADFTRELAKSIRRPAFLTVPAFALKMMLGEFSHELLDSKKVLPSVALEHGYGFQFPELAPALKNLLG